MAVKEIPYSIKTWAKDDRPREKLFHKGSQMLSDAELLSIVLGSGSRDESAVELARRILRTSGNSFNGLSRLSVNQLMKYKGVGLAKAVSVVAVMEIARRKNGMDLDTLPRVGGSSEAYGIMKPLLADLSHEEFWIIYLNNANKVLHKHQLSKGGMTATLVDIRLVLKKALEVEAVALILAHNHPSGKASPSEADRSLTRKLKNAAEAMDIKVLDHIIVAGKNYYSFADQQEI